MENIYIHQIKRVLGKERESIIVLVNSFLTSQNKKEIKEISYDSKGKPYISEYPDLCLSYTHSPKSIVLALGWKKRLGIDIENTERQERFTDKFWRVAFSEAELKNIRPQNCLLWWTLKEAALKMKGCGFSEDEANTYTVQKDKNFFSLYWKNKVITQGQWKSWIIDSERISVCFSVTG